MMQQAAIAQVEMEEEERRRKEKEDAAEERRRQEEADRVAALEQERQDKNG